MKYPLKYYYNNVNGTITLLKIMQKYNCNEIIFSSTSCVYGMAEINPISEKEETYPVNIYANTKLIIENILKEISKANPNFKSIILRYCAHDTGLIGEEPNGVINNIMPYNKEY